VRVATLVAALLTMIGLLGPVTARPAAARAEPLQVSLDGHRWSARIDRPLFESDRRWVPGDVETVTVWARNTSTDAASLTIQVLDQGGDSRLEDELQLTAMANGQPLTGTAGYPVGPGTPVPIDLALAFPASAGNASQGQRTDVMLRVTLTRRTGSVPPVPPASDLGLPDTGASALSSVLLATGLLLLSTGAAVLGGRSQLRRVRGER
jgi:hypothetical protein